MLNKMFFEHVRGVWVGDEGWREEWGQSGTVPGAVRLRENSFLRAVHSDHPVHPDVRPPDANWPLNRGGIYKAPARTSPSAQQPRTHSRCLDVHFVSGCYGA